MQLFGLLNLNKPAGITSRRAGRHGAAARSLRQGGTAGTLDPLASGVLVVGVGHATRLVEYVQEMPKRYEATFLLGRSSTTEDIEGDDHRTARRGATHRASNRPGGRAASAAKSSSDRRRSLR